MPVLYLYGILRCPGGCAQVPNAVELVQGEIGSISALDSRQGGVVRWEGGEAKDGSNSNLPVPSPLNKYRDRVCKYIEMTGFYPTILKFPELGPDIYLTEQVHETEARPTRQHQTRRLRRPR